MQFCYGDKNHVRILEEAEFWKRQEAEHTVVIREIVRNLEEEFIKKLEEFEKVLSSTEATIVQYIEKLARSNYLITPELTHKIMNLIKVTVQQSQIFISYLGTILKDSPAVKNNLAAVVVINHIIRESEYYLGIAKAYLNHMAYW